MAKRAQGIESVGGAPNGNSVPINGTDSGTGNVDGGEPIARTDGLIVVNPADIGGPASAGSGADNSGDAPKRRGRKPGSRSATGKGAALDINGVEHILFSAHTILAAVSKSPEMALDQSEAHQLAEAIANVSRHYDVAATQKTMDWTNLLMCMGLIYGTRIMAIRNNRARQARERRNTPDQNSVHIPGIGDVPASGVVQ